MGMDGSPYPNCWLIERMSHGKHLLMVAVIVVLNGIQHNQHKTSYWNQSSARVSHAMPAVQELAAAMAKMDAMRGHLAVKITCRVLGWKQSPVL